MDGVKVTTYVHCVSISCCWYSVF